MKETYMPANIEIITFESEDVVTASLPFNPFSLSPDDKTGEWDEE